MKSVKDVISHIKKDPLYLSMYQKREFLELLLEKKQLIAFIYIKDEKILMIALKHPLGLQELRRDSNINLIKDLLKIYNSIKADSIFAKIEDVKFFVADRAMKRKEKALNSQKIEKKPCVEISEGKFQNRIKDEKIHRIFEEIREVILAIR